MQWDFPDTNNIGCGSGLINSTRTDFFWNRQELSAPFSAGIICPFSPLLLMPPSRWWTFPHKLGQKYYQHFSVSAIQGLRIKREPANHQRATPVSFWLNMKARLKEYAENCQKIVPIRQNHVLQILVSEWVYTRSPRGLPLFPSKPCTRWAMTSVVHCFSACVNGVGCNEPGGTQQTMQMQAQPLNLKPVCLLKTSLN